MRINGVVVTWVVAIDPPGVRFPLNALVQGPLRFLILICVYHRSDTGFLLVLA